MNIPWKPQAYERMLCDFGLDPERLIPSGTRPRLVYAEQPGCWFTPQDRMRCELLRDLVQRSRLFDRRASGFYYLSNDGFTSTGDKQVLLWFELHPAVQPVRFVGSRFIRRHRRKTYSSLQIAGPTHERIQNVFDLCEGLLTSAAISPIAFVRWCQEKNEEGVWPGVRCLLPRGSRRELAALGDRLRSHYRLLDAHRHLVQTARLLRPGMSWTDYWNQVNRQFFNSEVRALDPILNRLVLAVRDPVQLSRTLIRTTGHPGDEPIPVIGVIAAKNTYRMVHFDPLQTCFFYETGNDQRVLIEWDEIVEMARVGLTGGPSGTLEYLLFAACGFYLIVDSTDSVQPFHRRACRIHREYTGLKFPWISLRPQWPAVNGAGRAQETFMDLYRKDFKLALEQTLAYFQAF